MQNAPESQQGDLSMGKPAQKSKTPLLIIAGVVIAALLAWFLMKPAPQPPAPASAPAVTAPVAPEPVAPAPVAESAPAPAPVVASAPAPRPDDNTVRPAFVEDLARWMVNGYQPAQKGPGKITIGLQEANMRYGVRMKGLRYAGKDLAAGRREVLKYAFTPDMVDSLYSLYSDRFMDAVAKNAATRANGKPLSEAQQSDMYAQYGQQLRALSGVLRGLSALPATTVANRVQKLHALSSAVAAADNRYGELVFAQEQAMEKGEKDKVAEMKGRIQNAARQYQRAVMVREQERQTFASAIKSNADAKKMSDDNAIYVAQWVERRIQSGATQFSAVGRAAEAVRNLADKFSAASR